MKWVQERSDRVEIEMASREKSVLGLFLPKIGYRNEAVYGRWLVDKERFSFETMDIIVCCVFKSVIFGKKESIKKIDTNARELDNNGVS